MSRQIIKQHNGKYLIFSSVVDNITYYNCTKKEIIELWCDEERQEITKRVERRIENIENGIKPFHQFNRTYDEVICLIGEIHGKEESKNVKTLIEKE